MGASLGLFGCHPATQSRSANLLSEVRSRDLGPLGTGSNMFRSGLVHSSGDVYIGTYGPQPGIIWKFDPKTHELTKVAAPGEYQLDCMVEAPNGRIYIGTAYNGIVYELDPKTGDVKNLGPPPIATLATWIFTMTRTRDGEIYGARGVGLFHLDWRTGKMEGLGVVPGKHEAPGVSSAPISRNLQERPDGLIWGDTNRWLFTFDRKGKQITPVVDVAAYDEACYGIIHCSEHSPFDDLSFAIYPRSNDRTPREALMVCRAATGKLEPLGMMSQFTGGILFPLGWWCGEDGKGEPRWLVTEIDQETRRSTVAVIDVQHRRVEERWEVPGNDTQPARPLDIDGPGVWFFTGTRGMVLRTDPAEKKLTRLAVNPMPVECRSVAFAPDGRIGTDTYDCGFVFTFNPDTREFVDHGRPYYDDHRSNFGPAAFAAGAARKDEPLFFVSNHGESELTVALYVTEIGANRHWKIGGPAIQLVRMNDGSVCGTFGRNPPSIDFDPKTCWTPAWIANGGTAFRYEPGSKRVDELKGWGKTGPIAPVPGAKDLAAVASDRTLRVFDLKDATASPLQEMQADEPIVALAAEAKRKRLYAALGNGTVVRYSVSKGKLGAPLVTGFGPTDRGFFVLPRSGRVVGVAGSGSVTVLSADVKNVSQITGPPPAPAGPAVHPNRDEWYYAQRSAVQYTLA
jgi:streptogramin lyase